MASKGGRSSRPSGKAGSSRFFAVLRGTVRASKISAGVFAGYERVWDGRIGGAACNDEDM